MISPTTRVRSAVDMRSIDCRRRKKRFLVETIPGSETRKVRNVRTALTVNASRCGLGCKETSIETQLERLTTERCASQQEILSDVIVIWHLLHFTIGHYGVYKHEGARAGEEKINDSVCKENLVGHDSNRFASSEMSKDFFGQHAQVSKTASVSREK